MKKSNMGLLLLIIFTLTLALPTAASEPQYANPVEMYRLQENTPFYNRELNGNTPYYITLDHKNCDFGNAGSWQVLTTMRGEAIEGGGKQDFIINKTNVSPGLAAEMTMNYSGANPTDCEILAVNGIPWQIFTSSEYDTRPSVGDAINLPGRKTASEEITWYMTKPEKRYSKTRPVLPAGSGKMVSIYDESTIVAIYTSTTVEAKHLVGRPFTQDGRLMIPVTGVVDYLGADVSWDDATKSAVIKQASKEIRLQDGNKIAYINGMAITMDAAPTIKDGRTYIPLRFVSDTLGFKVSWMGDIDTNVRRADIYN